MARPSPTYPKQSRLRALYDLVGKFLDSPQSSADEPLAEVIALYDSLKPAAEEAKSDVAA